MPKKTHTSRHQKRYQITLCCNETRRPLHRKMNLIFEILSKLSCQKLGDLVKFLVATTSKICAIVSAKNSTRSSSF